MKNEEPQIFTRTDDQNVPVDDTILGALEQEELSESLVREYIRGLLIETTEDDEDREVGEAEKLITLFLEDSNQITTAQMIPGQEKLVKDMERILIQVRKFIDTGETLAAQRDQLGSPPAGAEVEIERLSNRIINRLDSMIIDHIPDHPAGPRNFRNTKRASNWRRAITYCEYCWKNFSADQMTKIYPSGNRHVPEQCVIDINYIKTWAGVK